MKEHQNRLKFHTEIDISKGKSGQEELFFKWVGGLIPEDKLVLFKQLLTRPYLTNNVTAVIYERLHRIFEGTNAVFNYSFTGAGASTYRDLWQYRSGEVRETLKNIGWEYFKTEINSVLVVDMPRDAKVGTEIQPYFYWVTVDKIVDYKADPITGIMDYIIFYNRENGRGGGN